MKIDWPKITGRVITATGWTFETLYESSACDVFELIGYWLESPPVHDLLALRYLGPSEKRAKHSAPSSAAESVSQLPLLATTFHMPVRAVSERTRKLYEYAQSVLNAPKA